MLNLKKYVGKPVVITILDRHGKQEMVYGTVTEANRNLVKCDRAKLFPHQSSTSIPLRDYVVNTGSSQFVDMQLDDDHE